MGTGLASTEIGRLRGVYSVPRQNNLPVFVNTCGLSAPRESLISQIRKPAKLIGLTAAAFAWSGMVLAPMHFCASTLVAILTYGRQWRRR